MEMHFDRLKRDCRISADYHVAVIGARVFFSIENQKS